MTKSPTRGTKRPDASAEAETAALVAARYRPLPLLDLSENPKNVRRHPPRQISILKRSLLTFGWTRPLGEAGGVLFVGHGVYRAAMELAREGKCPALWPDPWLAPCLDLSHLSEQDRLAYLVADNRHPELADDDGDALIQLLGELHEDGVSPDLLGFSDADMAKLLGDDFPGKDALTAEPEPEAEAGHLETCPA